MASHYEAETNVDERLEMRAEGQPSVIIATPGGKYINMIILYV